MNIYIYIYLYIYICIWVHAYDGTPDFCAISEDTIREYTIWDTIEPYENQEKQRQIQTIQENLRGNS